MLQSQSVYVFVASEQAVTGPYRTAFCRANFGPYEIEIGNHVSVPQYCNGGVD